VALFDMNDKIKKLFGFGKYQNKEEKAFLNGYWLGILILFIVGGLFLIFNAT
jgi:hypothetical protein